MAQDDSPISRALAHTLKGHTSEDLRIGSCPDSWTLAKLALGEVDQATRQQLDFHIPFCETCLNDYLALIDREELEPLIQSHKRLFWEIHFCELAGKDVSVSCTSYRDKGELRIKAEQGAEVDISLRAVDANGRESLICGTETDVFGKINVTFNSTVASLYRCELKAKGKTVSVHIDLEQRGLGWRDVRNLTFDSNEYQIRTLIGKKLLCSVVPISVTRLPVLEIRVEKEGGDLIGEFTTLADGSLDFEIDELPRARSYLFYILRGEVTKRIAYVVHHGAVEDWINARHLEAEIVKKVSGA